MAVPSFLMDGIVEFAVDAGVDGSGVEGRRTELLAWRLVVRGRDPASTYHRQQGSL